MSSVSASVIEGLAERKAGKEDKDDEPKAVAPKVAEVAEVKPSKRKPRKKVVAVEAASKEEE